MFRSAGGVVRDKRIIMMASLPSAIIVLAIAILLLSGKAVSASYVSGVWDNFNYEQPATYWADAARTQGGDTGVLDLTVVQAQDGAAALPFPYQGSGALRSVSGEDLLEPYLSRFDSEGLGVILSIQPMGADVNDLIGILLQRYGQHRCIVGINVDMEWKETGTPQHVSNGERDSWFATIDRFNPGLKLFLTYFKDYSYFPSDDGKIVVMFDGTDDSQQNLMVAYGELARHFSNVGIYTGYRSSSPATASDQMILAAAPNTRYIIHTGDANSDPGTAASSFGSLAASAITPKALDLADMKDRIGLPSSGSSMPGLLTGGFSLPSFSSGAGNGFLNGFRPAQSSSVSQSEASGGDTGYTSASSKKSTGFSGTAGGGQQLFNGNLFSKVAFPAMPW